MPTLSLETTPSDWSFVQASLSDIAESDPLRRLELRHRALNLLAKESGSPGVLAELVRQGWNPDSGEDCPSLAAYFPSSINWEQFGSAPVRALRVLGRDTSRVRGYKFFVLVPGKPDLWMSRGPPPLPGWKGTGGTMNMEIHLSDWAYGLICYGRSNPIPLPSPASRPACLARVDAWASQPDVETCPPDGDQLSSLEFLVLALSRTTSLSSDHADRPLLAALKLGHAFHRLTWTVSAREEAAPYEIPWSAVIPWAMDRLVASGQNLAAAGLWRTWSRDFPEVALSMWQSSAPNPLGPSPPSWVAWRPALASDWAAMSSPQPPPAGSYNSAFRAWLEQASAPSHDVRLSPVPSSILLPSAHAKPVVPQTPSIEGPSWFQEALASVRSLPTSRRGRDLTCRSFQRWLAQSIADPDPKQVGPLTKRDMFRSVFLYAFSRDQASVVETLCRTGLDLSNAKDCLSGRISTPCWAVLLQNGWNPNDFWNNRHAYARIPGTPIQSWSASREPVSEPSWFALFRSDVINNQSSNVIRPVDRAFWDQMFSKVTDVNKALGGGVPHALLLLDRYDESRALSEWAQRLLKAGANPRHLCGRPPRPLMEQITSPWLAGIVNRAIVQDDRAALVAHLAAVDHLPSTVELQPPGRGRRL